MRRAADTRVGRRSHLVIVACAPVSPRRSPPGTVSLKQVKVIDITQQVIFVQKVVVDMQPMVTFECDTLTVRPWADDVIDSLGFDPRAPYVERFWLGVLGPSTTWLLRRSGDRVRPAPRGLRDVARRDGPGPGARRPGRSPFTVLAHRQPHDPVRAGPGADRRVPASWRSGGDCLRSTAARPPASRPPCRPPTSAGRRTSSRSHPPKPNAAGAASWRSACWSWERTWKRRSGSCCGGATTRRLAREAVSWAVAAHRSAAAAEAGLAPGAEVPAALPRSDRGAGARSRRSRGGVWDLGRVGSA